MKQREKISVMRFAQADRGEARGPSKRSATSSVKSFVLSSQQQALYGKITEENGFSMDAELERLQRAKPIKTSC
ncbi:hypothetical protein CLU92_1781 [Janthinobacterium sp. 61]|uniref:hypothetical protein n=1 Tax=Janthinobacterium sp. 61 TaxID=2035209 RepID=UPI000C701006|nr:hypothetical protein [Janthinobacterium sp. 61]PKV44441.1 hypothetical protein CLU92_1781 [Janthinobacterium sp. 61]